jgi:hypothetical protein
MSWATKPPYGLEIASDSMSPEQSCAIHVRNMKRLMDLRQQARLALGEQLAALKNSEAWRADPAACKCRTWEQFVCTMQWPSPFENSASLTPKGAEKLIDGFKDHLLRQHLEVA